MAGAPAFGPPSLLAFAGGLGLLFYGLTTLRDSLSQVAGTRLRRLAGLFAGNLWVGMIVGAVAAAITQSSSAVTVFVVGLADAGVLDLVQAAGVIMGANIGTTVTPQLLAFNLVGYPLPAIAVGAVFRFLAPRRGLRLAGTALIGAGLLVLGLQTMMSALAPLENSPLLVYALVNLGHRPLLAFLGGTAITGVLQSSTAVVSLLEVLAARGLVTLMGVYGVVLGANVGTCVTALLASAGGGAAARRAAVVHLAINAIGAALFLLPGTVLAPVLALGATDPARQVANIHTMFNLASAVVLVPFLRRIVALAEAVVPDGARGRQNGGGRGRRRR